MSAGQKGHLGQFHLFLLSFLGRSRRGWVETALSTLNALSAREARR
jgi:hypothetical protein